MKQNQRMFSMIPKVKELELRLAPPIPEEDEFQIFVDYNSKNSSVHGGKRAFEATLSSKGLVGYAKGISQPVCSSVAEAVLSDNNAFSVAANTAVTDGSNKRTASAPVVGWPPIGSFRKNIAGSSLSKPASKPDETPKDTVAGKSESFKTSLFVKVNMEGVPIGRKININAYNSYEDLSFAIYELFKRLLPVQRDPSTAESNNKMEGLEVNTSSLVKSNEYTLLYEDNEGDRMLVGDVPWHMFVSTVKKLLVLKSSELST